jgi:DNA-binding CsgD family transcriptional regulator
MSHSDEKFNHSDMPDNYLLPSSTTTAASQLEHFDQLLTALYACVDHEDGFTQFLQVFRKIFQVKTAALICMRVEPFKGIYSWASGYPPGLIKMLIKTGTLAKDEAIVRAGKEPSGSVYCFSGCNPDYDIFADISPVTKAWLKTVGITDNATLTFEVRSNERFVFLLNRVGKQGIFKQQELELLQRLQPHLERALSLFEALSHEKNVSEGLHSAIDNLHYPVALFSVVGRLVNINQTFRDLGERYGIFRVDDSTAQLTFNDKSTEEEFSRHLTACLFNVAQEQASVDVMFVKTEALPVRLTIRPLYNKKKRLSGVMVEARDSNTAKEYSATDVQKVLDCTEAEAKVIAKLLLGDDVAMAAESLNLSAHTVRGYVKSVMSKNDFHRQLDLIAALLKVLS